MSSVGAPALVTQLEGAETGSSVAGLGHVLDAVPGTRRDLESGAESAATTGVRRAESAATTVYATDLRLVRSASLIRTLIDCTLPSTGPSQPDMVRSPSSPKTRLRNFNQRNGIQVR
jgi:hypothetical protein